MNVLTVISLIFSGVMMMVGVTTFIITQVRESRKSAEVTGSQFVSIREDLLTVKVMLDDVSGAVNETRVDVKGLSVNLIEIDKRLSIAEASLKTAFMRIDELRDQKMDKKEA